MARSLQVTGKSDDHGEDATNSMGPESTTAQCTYCLDSRVVPCPVCEGTGILGRTIRCRYCKGRKMLDCPLCTLDLDEYAWSFDEE
eukprot:CAMPEP_0184685796 /NCGR_PEP_ID=MMETSP0312-20130426/20266_1 /TAXON_ID=31354 /ORGANISM="Compsopogon coeruleus, Strain SAG 36.94" /LENGTH=85 /DNA_ID=CAMNT_0027140263 /DNA_START=281 /DNA_END=538 /DNA_ORIENTATION=+